MLRYFHRLGTRQYYVLGPSDFIPISDQSDDIRRALQASNAPYGQTLYGTFEPVPSLPNHAPDANVHYVDDMSRRDGPYFRVWISPSIPLTPYSLRCAGCADAIEVNGVSFYHLSDVRTLGDGSVEILCESCAEDVLSTCERCMEEFRTANMSVHPWRDRLVCDACYDQESDDRTEAEEAHEDEEEEDRTIRSYHSSLFELYTTPWVHAHGGRHFGVELETEVQGGRDREEAATRLADASTRCRSLLLEKIATPSIPSTLASFENDGSLDHGFEMISAPMGLDAHRIYWREVLKVANRPHLASHNTSTCGLHVHMSRTGLTTTQIGKMVVFLNHPDNERLIRAIARRYRHEFCKIKYKTLQDTESHDRYEALNLTNDRTVEFRIFRGSLNADAVVAAVEFCHAVAEFCREDAPHGMTFSTDAFIHFLGSDPAIRKESATLRKYLTSRGIACA